MTAPYYFTRSAQPFYGRTYADTLASRENKRLGQDSQYTTRRMMHMHGRHLSGFGAVGTPSGPSGDSEFPDGDIRRMEDADDTFGSGIFDPDDRGPTANEEMGVFESSYSWPGYMAREVPFTVSRDVSDATTDAEMVFIPGGGFQYIEVNGRLKAPEVLGPTVRPGARRVPQRSSGRDQPYVSLQDPQDRPTLNQGVPVRAPSTFKPARQDWTWVRPVPEQWSRPLPIPAGRPVPSVSIVGGGMMPRQFVSPMQQPGASLRGFGATMAAAPAPAAPATEGPSVVKYALVGLLIGAAAGVAVSIMKRK